MFRTRGQRRWFRSLPVFLFTMLLLLVPGAAGAVAATGAATAAVAPVTLLTIDGAIGPASADYAVRGIARAAKGGSQLVILQIDTPGGLDTSMRTLIKAILTAPVPVAAYVAPGGARAASAGTYIVYASHIAAMAPGTNLGAATPVQLGIGAAPEREPAAPAPGPSGRDGAAGARSPPAAAPAPAQPAQADSAMARKQLNDAAAYIRGLAQLRGRNADWADKAVREALSLPANDALKVGVIDYVAPDVRALLALVDGKTVKVLGSAVRLRTAGAPVIDARPDWHATLLSTITDPSVALILLTVGAYGLLFEFMSPGAVAPGVIGAFCLLLGLYGLQLLPLNYAGLAFIALGIGCMVAEAFLPSFGVVGLGGIAAFATGALILIDTDLPGYGVPVGLVATLAVGSALLIAATGAMAVKTRRRKVVSGDLASCSAEVIDAIHEHRHAHGLHEAWANVGGETWRVVSAAPLHRAQKVKVLARRGRLLEVAPAESAGNGGTA